MPAPLSVLPRQGWRQNDRHETLRIDDHILNAVHQKPGATVPAEFFQVGGRVDRRKYGPGVISILCSSCFCGAGWVRLAP